MTKPCKHGHNSGRHASYVQGKYKHLGQCIECQRIKNLGRIKPGTPVDTLANYICEALREYSEA